MDAKQIADKVLAAFPSAVTAGDDEAIDSYIQVDADSWADVATFLRDTCGMDHLMCITSIDRGDDLEAVYTMENMGEKREVFTVRVKVPRETPDIPSVEKIWRTADWHEREAWDLMGINFVGHRNLKRILCAEDWEGHPLRKDYQSPDYYHGVRNNVV